jgi:hypothetical protein
MRELVEKETIFMPLRFVKKSSGIFSTLREANF